MSEEIWYFFSTPLVDERGNVWGMIEEQGERVEPCTRIRTREERSSSWVRWQRRPLLLEFYPHRPNVLLSADMGIEMGIVCSKTRWVLWGRGHRTRNLRHIGLIDLIFPVATRETRRELVEQKCLQVVVAVNTDQLLDKVSMRFTTSFYASLFNDSVSNARSRLPGHV